MNHETMTASNELLRHVYIFINWGQRISLAIVKVVFPIRARSFQAFWLRRNCILSPGVSHFFTLQMYILYGTQTKNGPFNVDFIQCWNGEGKNPVAFY